MVVRQRPAGAGRKVTFVLLTLSPLGEILASEGFTLIRVHIGLLPSGASSASGARGVPAPR